jgi:predicted aminopeptidase
MNVRRYFKSPWHPIILAGALISLNGCYLAKQGAFIIRYSFEATPIEKLQKSPGTPNDLRRFFELVTTIRRFAVDSIGLKRNRNYSTYVTVNKKYLVDNVYAAGRDNFTQYQWRYPILGAMPYKGFFERPDAERERHRLEQKGYDVHIGRIDAFSTLGVLPDPIYSFMKEYPPFRLASLIMHEQTHATLFIKGHIRFNEQMAGFVGDEGALWFIRSTYGDSSTEYRDALAEWQDSDVYSNLLTLLYTQLEKVYTANTTSEEKIKFKQARIKQFKDSLTSNYDRIFKTPSYRGISRAEINNAYLAISMTYSQDLGNFYALFNQHNRDLRTTIGLLKSLGTYKGDPEARLREMIASP